jgi:hypothetical protein
MRHNRWWALALIPMLLFAVSDCVFSPKTKNAPPTGEADYPLPTTPRMVLTNLQKAYIGRNLDEYLKLFDPSFTFEVSPKDTQSDPSIGESWGMAVERTIHDHMFHSDAVENITLSFNEPLPAELETVEFPGQNLWKLRLDGVQLDVYQREAEGLMDYKVSSGTAHFFMKPDSTHLSNGLPVWYIVRWRDEPIGDLAAKRLTAAL